MYMYIKVHVIQSLLLAHAFTLSIFLFVAYYRYQYLRPKVMLYRNMIISKQILKELACWSLNMLLSKEKQ